MRRTPLLILLALVPVLSLLAACGAVSAKGPTPELLGAIDVALAEGLLDDGRPDAALAAAVITTPRSGAGFLLPRICPPDAGAWRACTILRQAHAPQGCAP